MRKKNEQEREGDGNRRRRNRRTRGVADYASADSGKLLSAVKTVCATGGAIRFGYTGDGGAYAIGIYGDGDPYTDYVKPDEDINKYLDDLIEEWE